MLKPWLAIFYLLSRFPLPRFQRPLLNYGCTTNDFAHSSDDNPRTHRAASARVNESINSEWWIFFSLAIRYATIHQRAWIAGLLPTDHLCPCRQSTVAGLHIAKLFNRGPLLLIYNCIAFKHRVADRPIA